MSHVVRWALTLSLTGIAVPIVVTEVRERQRTSHRPSDRGPRTVVEPSSARGVKERRTELPRLEPFLDRWLEPEAVADRIVHLSSATGTPLSVRQTDHVHRAAESFRRAFVQEAPVEGHEVSIRSEIDADALEEALELVAIAFPDDSRPDLESKLLEWTAQLDVIIEEHQFEFDRLMAEGEVALSENRAIIEERVAARNAELIKVLRKKGKAVPDFQFPYDRAFDTDYVMELFAQMQSFRETLSNR